MDFSLISKTGERLINEDAVGETSLGDRHAFIVCDGLGGHEKGEIASSIAVNTAKEVFQKEASKNIFSIENCLRLCMEESNARILDYQDSHLQAADMKTTMTVLICDEQRYQWAHAGDSRLYLFENRRLKYWTKDHSVPQMLANAGQIKESEIRFHKDRNRLLQVLGNREAPLRYSVSDEIALSGVPAVLMCTDGFWEWITESEMCALLKKADSAGEWLSLMEKIVAEKGHGNQMDNYSAITVYGGKMPKKNKWFSALFG